MLGTEDSEIKGNLASPFMRSMMKINDSALFYLQIYPAMPPSILLW